MPDHFATFSLPRSPWVDPDVLKTRFHQLSATLHPDAGGTAEAFTALNEAWQTLRDPAACLRHYLELAHPTALPLASQTPPDLADLFMDIASARQSVQSLTIRLRTASSSLTRSLLELERRSLLARLDSLTTQIATRLQSTQSTLRDTQNLPIPQLAAILSTLVFLGKWSVQLRESALALSI